MTDPPAFSRVTISAAAIAGVCVDECGGGDVDVSRLAGWLLLPPLLATRVGMTSLQRRGEENDIFVALPRTLALNQVVALRHVANFISSRKSSKVPRPPGERRGREGGREGVELTPRRRHKRKNQAESRAKQLRSSVFTRASVRPCPPPRSSPVSFPHLHHQQSCCRWGMPQNEEGDKWLARWLDGRECRGG